MTDSLVERLREASVGMGTRDPEDYTFAISTFVALEAAADRIEELEAALSEATKGLDYYEECMALRKENEKLLFAHQWIAKQAAEIEKLKDLVAKLAPTYANTPFIHHMTGAEKGKMPEFIWVTPAYGADWSQVYERTDKIVGGMGS